MTPSQLHKLLAAPELVVVDLVDHALRSLRLALLAEHPLLDGDDAHDDPPVQRRARALLHRAHDLRQALRDYRRLVDRVLHEPDDRDLPF
jgi:hypothetical protein